MDAKTAELIERAGGLDQILRDLERFDDDLRYFESIREQLQREHVDQWVAIYDGAVIAIAEDPDQLMVQLRTAGVSAAHALVEQILPSDTVIL